MSKAVNKKIQQTIKECNMFPEFPDDIDPNNEDDMMYGDFYLLKKYSQEYGFNLKKIESKTNHEEYEECINEEVKKLPEDKRKFFAFKNWMWIRLYGKHRLFELINNLDLNDFEINLPSFAWLGDDYLSQFINYPNIYHVLSVFTVFYDPKISKCCDIDVIYNTFQHQNMCSHEMRVNVIDSNSYTFKEEKFPKREYEIEKKYDLVILDISHSQIESLDKTAILDIKDDSGYYAGDDIQCNILHIINYLNTNGMAIVKVPFTDISRLNENLIDENIIDKIIYLPSEKELFANEEVIEVKDAYVIVKNNKENEEIEFINKETDERWHVSNEQIKKNNGYTNIKIYNKHNFKLNKLFRIKEDNKKQLDIINAESKFINKEIDEWDL